MGGRISVKATLKVEIVRVVENIYKQLNIRKSEPQIGDTPKGAGEIYKALSAQLDTIQNSHRSIQERFNNISPIKDEISQDATSREIEKDWSQSDE